MGRVDKSAALRSDNRYPYCPLGHYFDHLPCNIHNHRDTPSIIKHKGELKCTISCRIQQSLLTDIPRVRTLKGTCSDSESKWQERKATWPHNSNVLMPSFSYTNLITMAEIGLQLFYWLFATHLGIFYLLKNILCWVQRGKEGRHQSLPRTMSGLGHSLKNKTVPGEGLTSLAA